MPRNCTSYFITISPQDRTLQYSKLKFANPTYCVFLDDELAIKHIFKKNRITRYIIFPELDDKGRLHYHGKITSLTESQRVSLYKSVRPTLQRIGFVDLQPVKNELECLYYCKKQFAFTSQVLERYQPISPQIQNITVGGRRGFKSQRDLVDSKNPITNYWDLEGL